MSENENIRTQVAEAYKKAVAEPGGSCCGSSEAIPKGVAVKMAGYTREELTALPEDAVVNSFGCGNPLAFSEVQEGDVVLDLGSGAGIDILIAGKMVGPTGKAIGVDMTDEMITAGNENIKVSGMTNVEIRKGIIEELPIEDNSVDWVISNCVINLSPEKDKVFAEINRVLKPGGKMQVSDIVANDLPEWVYNTPALYNSCISGAVSEKEYLKGLENAGMTNATVKDRLTYEPSQLKDLVDSEIIDTGCCGSGIPEALIDVAARDLSGKVESLKIYAEKPKD